MERIKNTVILFFLVLSLWSSLVYADNRDQQRQLFWQAREYLLSGRYQQFATQQIYLKDYPLYPYLIYIQLKQQLSSKETDAIDSFLNTYKDTPLALKLRGEWLTHLAKKQDWSHFIRYYQPVYGTTLQCYYLNALLATQQKQLAFQKIPILWLHAGVAVPSPCKTVFSRWEKSRGLTKALVWKKLEYAIKQNNVALIQYLSRFLSTEERQQVKHWYQVYRHPLLVEQSDQFNGEDKRDRKILFDGIKRLANKDPYELADSWHLLTKTYAFSEAEKQQLMRYLAIALVRRADSLAGDWLKQIKSPYADTILREWRVRYSLLTGQWDSVLYWLNRLSPTEQRLPCWRYWRARALAETHHTEAASAIYTRLAQEIDYYGVLASQHLKQAYHPTMQRSAGDKRGLEKNAAIQRAQELYKLGFTGDARREWQWALANPMTTAQLQAAAQLAKQWEWYDLAIIGAAKAKIYHDIRLRFPLAYRVSVLAAARTMHLNAAWIWAIMRQESAFMWNAKSSAGALGLMQVMPSTGKQLARNLHLQTIDLLDPKLNIRLGSFYLRHLLELFDGNATLATAAYNAGPTRIKNYQSLFQRLPKDIWIEILPWKETRDYIKNVNLARNIYSQI